MIISTREYFATYNLTCAPIRGLIMYVYSSMPIYGKCMFSKRYCIFEFWIICFIFTANSWKHIYFISTDILICTHLLACKFNFPSKCVLTCNLYNKYMSEVNDELCKKGNISWTLLTKPQEVLNRQLSVGHFLWY